MSLEASCRNGPREEWRAAASVQAAGQVSADESAPAPDSPRDARDSAPRLSAMAWEAEQALYRAAWKAHNE